MVITDLLQFLLDSISLNKSVYSCTLKCSLLWREQGLSFFMSAKSLKSCICTKTCFLKLDSNHILLMHSSARRHAFKRCPISSHHSAAHPQLNLSPLLDFSFKVACYNIQWHNLALEKLSLTCLNYSFLKKLIIIPVHLKVDTSLSLISSTSLILTPSSCQNWFRLLLIALSDRHGSGPRSDSFLESQNLGASAHVHTSVGGTKVMVSVSDNSEGEN